MSSDEYPRRAVKIPHPKVAGADLFGWLWGFPDKFVPPLEFD
jgi:hypothetical protein